MKGRAKSEHLHRLKQVALRGSVGLIELEVHTRISEYRVYEWLALWTCE